MNNFDITKYLEIAIRRKYWIIIPFMITIIIGLAYVLQAPKVYEAKTLILVQEQRVPQDFVRSIVSASVEDRLRTITQQVTSRTNLEKIIKEHGLFNDSEMFIDGKVKKLREMINIDVSYRGGRRGEETGSFTISLRGKDSKKITEVTNALASNFILENLKIRESQALGTAVFLSDELESIEKQLMEKEKNLMAYRERYMGGLPEQLQTNLSILTRLQEQLDQYLTSIHDAENRRITIQKEITVTREARQDSIGTTGVQGEGNNELASLKSQLLTMKLKYTDNHPDVIRLKEMIARLEAEQSLTNDQDTPSDGETRVFSNVEQTLRRQLIEVEQEIEQLKNEVVETRSQIEKYDKLVEDTPKREQELISLNRDYNNLREVYNSLLNRKLESEIAVSMEKKQKGEQFQVIDPAKVPINPVEPDVKKLLMMIFALGLGLGCGIAYVRDLMDTSYKSPEECEKELNLPILVSLPFRYTEPEQRRIRRKGILVAASVCVGFVLALITIVLAAKGTEKTMEYFTKMLG